MTPSPGRILAFVEAVGHPSVGWILESDEAFAEEVSNAGPNLHDHHVSLPLGRGLQVLEGWVEHTNGPDPDVSLVGEWRYLTHWEMCRLRCGSPIFTRVTERGDHDGR